MKFHVYNPNNKPPEDLPVIYGFNNGGNNNFLYAQLITQDGYDVGSHICSDECFMPGDLGCLENSRPDRHETFMEVYPGGYRMDFVSHSDVASHPGLRKAFVANNLLKDDSVEGSSQAKIEITQE